MRGTTGLSPEPGNSPAFLRREGLEDEEGEESETSGSRVSVDIPTRVTARASIQAPPPYLVTGSFALAQPQEAE